jgi:hypothetical protein
MFGKNHNTSRINCDTGKLQFYFRQSAQHQAFSNVEIFWPDNEAIFYSPRRKVVGELKLKRLSPEARTTLEQMFELFKGLTLNQPVDATAIPDKIAELGEIAGISKKPERAAFLDYPIPEALSLISGLRTRVPLILGKSRCYLRLSAHILLEVAKEDLNLIQVLGFELNQEGLHYVREDATIIKTQQPILVLNNPFDKAGQLPVNFLKAYLKMLLTIELLKEALFAINLWNIYLVEPQTFSSFFDLQTILYLIGLPEEKSTIILSNSPQEVPQGQTIEFSLPPRITSDLQDRSKDLIAALAYLIHFRRLQLPAEHPLTSSAIHITAGSFQHIIPAYQKVHAA